MQLCPFSAINLLPQFITLNKPSLDTIFSAKISSLSSKDSAAKHTSFPTSREIAERKSFN